MTSIDAILSLSGGLDSGVLLAKLADSHTRVLPVSFAYGQRHQSRELQAARDLAYYYGFRDVHRIMDLSGLFYSRTSSHSVLLNPESKMPHLTYQQLELETGPSPTYVPNRNALFISIIAGLALQHEAPSVYIATHAEDARNWAYPDCTPEFNGAMSNAVYVGTYMKVRLYTPFQWMMKRDVVHLGLQLKAPMGLTWSCYEGGDHPCGTCPTCVERAEAFEWNQAIDPSLSN